MGPMERYIKRQIIADLKKKMVFLGGPRQTGKTTLAKAIIANAPQGYLNWDIDDDRQRILAKTFPAAPIWVFDELHKFRRWRNYLKGLFDKFGKSQPILVTGSARLDYYRFGGDSLQGRYHYLRLHPLSVAELKMTSAADFAQLLLLGGFPEPFLSGSEVEARRWAREYRTRMIREDLIQLEQVQDLASIELLAMRLPSLVGSPLSINAVREDLQISHKTVAKWIVILERLYQVFRVAPFGAPRIRAVRKENKLYQFNWALVEEEGPRFENCIASHLLKWCHFIEDTEGFDMELRYFRDTDGREVDFVILKDRKPILFVEAKVGDTNVAPALRYLKKKFPSVKAVQVVGKFGVDAVSGDGIAIQSATLFLNSLV